MKPLLVGEAPGAEQHQRHLAFSGKLGARIARLAGVSRTAIPHMFEVHNLLDDWPLRTAYDYRAGTLRAQLIASTAARGNLIIMTGRRVAHCFGAPRRMPFFEIIEGPRELVLVPHMGGANPWWDSATNVAKATAFFKQFQLPGDTP